MDWIFRKEKEKPILYSVKFSELKRDELSENLPKTKLYHLIVVQHNHTLLFF